MELHERLVTTKPGAPRSAEGAVRRPQELDPHARHQRARPAAHGPGDRPRRHARPRGRRHPPASLRRDGHLPRGPRAAARRRSPTTSSATARSSGCSPTTRSRRSWSTARARSGSSARAGSTRRPCASATTRTCAGSSTGWSRRSGGASTSPRRWSTPASPTARASTRSSRRSRSRARCSRSASSRASASALAGHGQHRLAQRGVGRVPAALHPGAAQHPRSRAAPARARRRS